MAQRPAAAADRGVCGVGGNRSGRMTAAPALVTAAVSVGSLHTLAPHQLVLPNLEKHREEVR